MERETLQELMERIGKQGYHVLLRYDPQREENPWTGVVDLYRNGEWITGRHDCHRAVDAVRSALERVEEQL